MSTSCETTTREAGAFSLIELLVAMAVLAILLVALTSIFSNMSNITGSSARRIDENAQATAIFDRIALDLNACIRVKSRFFKNQTLDGAVAPRNDGLQLLSEVTSPEAGSRFAVVRYGEAPVEDQNGSTKPALHRSVAPLGWSDSTLEPASGTAPVSQPLAPGIIRFETAFVGSDGIVADPANTADGTVIVAIAVLDEETFRLLKPDELQALATRLPDAIAGATPLETWNNVSLDDLPHQIRRNLRFYQRFFSQR